MESVVAAVVACPEKGCVGGVKGRVIRVWISVCMAVAATFWLGTGDAEAQYHASADAAADIPPVYLQEYQRAGAAYGVDWTILAAIGKVESGHGAAEPYGCILGPPTPYGYAYGPMQSLVSSWATLGIDGNGDGIVDSCDYEDAIPSTANYLPQSGAPWDYYSAIYAYNHSDLYVQPVLAQACTYYQGYVTGVY